MPYASKSQIEAAREVPLLDFLQRHNPDDLVAEGGNAYSLKSHTSLKLSNGKWCWWSNGKMGGVNALEYLIKVENMKFPEAVHLINGVSGFSHSTAQSQKKSAPKPAPVVQERDVQLPVPHSDNRRVTAYLLNRGIDMDVLDYCFEWGFIYEDAAHHNAVFVGYHDNVPKYATLRGATTGNHFMREVNGSDKAYGFAILAPHKNDVVNVFESAIDAISYLTLTKRNGGDWMAENVLSLGGVYKGREGEIAPLPVALATYLDAHHDTSTIVLRLDNDAVGRSAGQSIAAALEGRTVVIALPEEGKDYNEWLQRTKGFSSRRREVQR